MEPLSEKSKIQCHSGSVKDRHTEVLLMLEGCRRRLRDVRNDLRRDDLLDTRIRLWNAEQQVKRAEELLREKTAHQTPAESG